MSKSKIEWCDETSNPIRTEETGGHWCKKCAPECAGCYAETINNSDFFGFASHLPYTGEPPALVLVKEELQKRVRRRTLKWVFVGSMTDVFGEWVSRAWHIAILNAAFAAKKQISMFLTKRADVAAIAIAAWLRDNNLVELPDYMPIGVSVGHRQSIDKIEALCSISAQLRFLSCEPLIDDIALPIHQYRGRRARRTASPEQWIGTPEGRIGWVIIGCESGKDARGHEQYQARALRIITQCLAAGVPVMHKQCAIYKNGKWVVSKNPEEWPAPLRHRQFPKVER